MTDIRFQKFVSESFREGIIFRELRLSAEEVEEMKDSFPRAVFKRTSEMVSSKAWYEVVLRPNSIESPSKKALEDENRRLKKELELLKLSKVKYSK